MSVPDDLPAKVYLKPGELYFSARPAIVSTVLGSCVSVTMFHPDQRVGAICHAVLPEAKTQGEAFRYVDSSIRIMLRGFRRHGISPHEIEVKLFGGAEMLQADGTRGGVSVGKQNIEAALDVIEKEGLPLIISDLGGTLGRKILFHTHTGEILLKRLRKNKRLP